MGLLGKSSKGKADHAGKTIIAAGSKFRGELVLEAELHIDGYMNGTIESSSDVTIGQSGHFEGNLRARQVLISGYFHGKIECERLELVAQGKVYGEVSSQVLVIEPGAQFIGESQSRGTAATPALDHRPADESPALVTATE